MSFRSLLVYGSSIVIACGVAACAATNDATGSNLLQSDAGEGRDAASISDAEPTSAGNCPDGCTPNSQGSCEGDLSCSGCPANPQQPTSATCTQSGQRCVYPPACGGAECDCFETDSGALEWSCVVRAC